MKRIEDVKTGMVRRKNVTSYFERELTKRGKGYIKAIGPSFIEEELTPKQIHDLNLPTNRTLRNNSNSLGLTWQFKNEITRISRLVEIREYGDNYLKSPSIYNGDIDKAYDFFSPHIFLVVEYDNENNPCKFSNLVEVGSIPKKMFYFSESKGNRNRINIKGFSRYFTMYKMSKHRSGILNRPDVIDQLDIILSGKE